MSYLCSSKLNAVIFILFFALQIPFVASAPQAVLSSTSATLSTTAPTTQWSSSPGVTPKVVANEWYASWYGSELPPSHILWSRYDPLMIAFAWFTLNYLIRQRSWEILFMFGRLVEKPHQALLLSTSTVRVEDQCKLCHSNSPQCSATIDRRLGRVARKCSRQ